MRVCRRVERDEVEPIEQPIDQPVGSFAVVTGPLPEVNDGTEITRVEPDPNASPPPFNIGY